MLGCIGMSYETAVQGMDDKPMTRRPHDYTDIGLCTCLLTTVLPAWVVFIGLLLIVDWVVG